tara:strand:+ start:275 stop:511 length:237 start_codon:yes stop_codon:yes gene_type:complete
MSKKLNLYIQCILNENNGFSKTDQKFRARNSLAAAKKAFRNNKNLLKVYILDTDDSKVYAYDTKSFFKVKKPFQKNRK